MDGWGNGTACASGASTRGRTVAPPSGKLGEMTSTNRGSSDRWTSTNRRMNEGDATAASSVQMSVQIYALTIIRTDWSSTSSWCCGERRRATAEGEHEERWWLVADIIKRTRDYIQSTISWLVTGGAVINRTRFYSICAELYTMNRGAVSIFAVWRILLGFTEYSWSLECRDRETRRLCLVADSKIWHQGDKSYYWSDIASVVRSGRTCSIV